MWRTQTRVWPGGHPTVLSVDWFGLRLTSSSRLYTASNIRVVAVAWHLLQIKGAKNEKKRVGRLAPRPPSVIPALCGHWARLGGGVSALSMQLQAAQRPQHHHTGWGKIGGRVTPSCVRPSSNRKQPPRPRPHPHSRPPRRRVRFSAPPVARGDCPLPARPSALPLLTLGTAARSRHQS